MKCPKCGYTSFDHLQECKKCQTDLTEHKSRFGLRSIFFPERASAIEASLVAEVESESPEADESASDASERAFAYDFLADSAPEPGELPLDDLLGGAGGEAERLADPALDEVPSETAAAGDHEFFTEAAEQPPAFSREPESADDGEDDFEFPAMGEAGAEETAEFLDLDLDLSYDSAPAAGESLAVGFAVDEDSLEALPPLDDEPTFSFDEVAVGTMEPFPGDGSLEMNDDEGVTSAELPEAVDEEAEAERAAGRQGAMEGPGDPFDFRESVDGRAPAGKPGVELQPPRLESLPSAGAVEPGAMDVERLEMAAGELPPLHPGQSVLTWTDDLPPSLEGDFASASEPAQPSEAAATDLRGSAEVPPVTTAALPDETPRLFGRTAAAVTDFVFLGFLFVIFFLAGNLALGDSRPLAATLSELLVPYFLVFFCLCFGYFTLFHFLVGQTLGKMLFQLRVVSNDQEPLFFSQAFLRSTGGLVSLLPVGLGFLSVALDRQGRGWNDRLAGTRVIAATGRRSGSSREESGVEGGLERN